MQLIELLQLGLEIRTHDHGPCTIDYSWEQAKKAARSARPFQPPCPYDVDRPVDNTALPGTNTVQLVPSVSRAGTTSAGTARSFCAPRMRQNRGMPRTRRMHSRRWDRDGTRTEPSLARDLYKPRHPILE